MHAQGAINVREGDQLVLAPTMTHMVTIQLAAATLPLGRAFPKYLDKDPKGLHVRAWRLRGLCAKTRGPYQDKSNRVAVRNTTELPPVQRTLRSTLSPAASSTTGSSTRARSYRRGALRPVAAAWPRTSADRSGLRAGRRFRRRWRCSRSAVGTRCVQGGTSPSQRSRCGPGLQSGHQLLVLPVHRFLHVCALAQGVRRAGAHPDRDRAPSLPRAADRFSRPARAGQRRRAGDEAAACWTGQPAASRSDTLPVAAQGRACVRFIA